MSNQKENQPVANAVEVEMQKYIIGSSEILQISRQMRAKERLNSTKPELDLEDTTLNLKPDKVPVHTPESLFAQLVNNPKAAAISLISKDYIEKVEILNNNFDNGRISQFEYQQAKTELDTNYQSQVKNIKI